MPSASSKKSTTVRSPIVALRRAAIRSIHPIAPAGAARLAVRWFVTPDRAVSLRAADAARRGASRPPAPTHAPVPLVLRAAGESLAAWSWGRGPLVLLVHGWNGRSFQLTAIAEALAAAGHRAVAFDLPAHGRSTGRTATIPDMAAAIREVSDQLGGARALIAHSLGAAAATVALSRGMRVERAVFIAPPVRPDLWLLHFGRELGLPSSADPHLLAAIEARAGTPLATVLPLRLAPAQATELLVVHDRADRRVPFASGEALARAWPGARLVPTEGLGHTRILSNPAVVETVARFIGDPPADLAARHALRDRHMRAFADDVSAA